MLCSEESVSFPLTNPSPWPPSQCQPHPRCCSAVGSLVQARPPAQGAPCPQHRGSGPAVHTAAAGAPCHPQPPGSVGGTHSDAGGVHTQAECRTLAFTGSQQEPKYIHADFTGDKCIYFCPPPPQKSYCFCFFAYFLFQKGSAVDDQHFASAV